MAIEVGDKRSYSRYALWFPVTVDGAARQTWAVCKDVSAGGILISGSSGLAIGEVVTLNFRLTPDSEERRMTGRIVRIETRAGIWPYLALVLCALVIWGAHALAVLPPH